MKKKLNDKSKKLENILRISEDLSKDSTKKKKIKEIGGPKGLEPTRYGDWERKGIAVDF